VDLTFLKYSNGVLISTLGMPSRSLNRVNRSNMSGRGPPAKMKNKKIKLRKQNYSINGNLPPPSPLPYSKTVSLLLSLFLKFSTVYKICSQIIKNNNQKWKQTSYLFDIGLGAVRVGGREMSQDRSAVESLPIKRVARHLVE
jgi:hypothetical protein